MFPLILVRGVCVCVCVCVCRMGVCVGVCVCGVGWACVIVICMYVKLSWCFNNLQTTMAHTQPAATLLS